MIDYSSLREFMKANEVFTRWAVCLDEQIKSGLADWIDTQQDVINKAQELNADLDGIDGTIWAFMQAPHTDIPDLELASRKDFVLSSILGLFRLNKDDTL